MTSSRFTDVFLGSEEHHRMFATTATTTATTTTTQKDTGSSSNQHTMQFRLLENCLAMGSPSRPDTNTPLWKEWYGSSNSGSEEDTTTTTPRHVTYGYDRCRVLFTLNT